ncbi:MAG: CoA pyrophosphatase [Thermoplasmata archaeon]|nr:CoA pyrophosphatase [Thermoplasmata archaeon]
MEAWEEELKERLRSDQPEAPQDGPSAAVALLLRWSDVLEGLLIHRIERDDDPWSGQIALPGGMHHRRDGTPMETARRETQEEVAVDLATSFAYLGRLPRVRPANVSRLTVFPYVFASRADVSPEPGSEVQAVFWTSLPALRASRTTRTVQASGREFRVPAYLFQEYVVWGLTYRILTTLFDLRLRYL